MLERPLDHKALGALAVSAVGAAAAVGYCICGCGSRLKGLPSSKVGLLTQECSVPRLGFTIRYPSGWEWREETPQDTSELGGTSVIAFSPANDPECSVMLVIEPLPADSVPLMTYAEKAMRNTSNQLAELGMELSDMPSSFTSAEINGREFVQWQISVTNREDDDVNLYHTWNWYAQKNYSKK